MTEPQIRRPLSTTLAGGGLLLAGVLAAGLLLWGGVEKIFEPAPPPVGETAPDYRLELTDGRVLGPESLKGKVVLLDFWSTTCLACQIATPKHNRLHERYADEGLVVIGVNQDPSEDRTEVESYGSERPMEYPIALDPGGTLAERFGARVLPGLVLIDRQGRLRRRYTGVTAESRALRDVKQLLAEDQS